MRRCAFLTLSDPTGWVMDDELAIVPFREHGWVVDTVPWNRPGVDWSTFELVVIRSTWDYQDHAEAFGAVLETIQAHTRLENSLALVRWNLQKTYLRELAAAGVPTVPTVWRDGLQAGELPGLVEELGVPEAVIKPVLSGNAQGAYRLTAQPGPALSAEVESYFKGRPLMLQPFEPAILSEGEYALIYFNGRFSHCVLKTPKGGDFRVQEEHGGDIRQVTPEPALAAAGASAMAALSEVPLYARADFVRAVEGGFRLMELELVEPSLYLRKDAQAAERLARAVAERCDQAPI